MPTAHKATALEGLSLVTGPRDPLKDRSREHGLVISL